MKYPVYNLTAKKVKDISLPQQIAKHIPDHNLIHWVYLGLSHNRRKARAHTKTRGLVRGGGRKPWRQKGTGNARTGSIRNPIFRGGGITFGPTNQKNYTKKVNKKERAKAFYSALIGKIKDREIRLISQFELAKPSTKKMLKLFQVLKTSTKSTLIVTSKKNLNLAKSINNIDKVRLQPGINISCLELLNYQYIYFEQSVLQELLKRYQVQTKQQESLKQSAITSAPSKNQATRSLKSAQESKSSRTSSEKSSKSQGSQKKAE
ncbi:MAG: 50S ribosomal protein L4 [Candidatus Moranbacteria bacterium]|nr:50S ribosomal protein L4 [Candidatus Moranbacteria bacterium]